MSAQQFAGGDERFIRRYEYEDGWVVAADLGAYDAEADVDVIGTTAVLVVDTGDKVTQTEFELPDGETTVETNNGILTITIQK
jgi:hypothetical protein